MDVLTTDDPAELLDRCQALFVADPVSTNVTSDVVAAGHRAVLFTDLADPTSNSIYAAVGYRRVGNGLVLRLGGGRRSAA